MRDWDKTIDELRKNIEKIFKVNDPMILSKAETNVKNSQLKLELKNLMRKVLFFLVI